VDKRWSC